jgi:hypothetical protein
MLLLCVVIIVVVLLIIYNISIKQTLTQDGQPGVIDKAQNKNVKSWDTKPVHIKVAMIRHIVKGVQKGKYSVSGLVSIINKSDLLPQ